MFPHAERFGATTVTLPLFTLMNEGDVDARRAARSTKFANNTENKRK